MLQHVCIFAQDTTIIPANTEIPAYTKPVKVSRLDKLREKGLSISGAIGIQLGYYYANGIPNRSIPFTYKLNGFVNIKYKDIIDLPFSFVISSQDNIFNQPLGISPKYKWLTVHAGYRNIAWSQYGLAGQNILGIGIEANPKYFRSGILFGRINRGSNINDTTKLDSLAVLTYQPSYKRLGLAVKIGAGTENNYVDFIYFRAWDKFKKDSLFYLSDAGNKSFLSPSENANFSIVTSNKIGKYITLKAEYSISTTNINRTLAKTGTLPDGYIKAAKILMKPNASAIAGHAANFSGIFSKNRYTTNVNMELITQNYVSYGAYYFQTNTYKVGAMQSLPLHKNKNGNLNINLQYLNDNLNKMKPFVNNRIIAGLGYNYNVAKFGINTQYTVAYSKQKIVNDSVIGTTSESLMLNQANHTFVIVPRYTIIKGSKIHTLLLTETFNVLSDFNKNTKTQSQFFNNLANISYIGVIAEKYLTIQSSFFTNYIKNYQIAVVSYGLSVGTTTQFLKNKMNMNDMISASISKQAIVLNALVGLSYQPEKHHLLSFSNNLIWNKSRITSAPSFIENRSLLSYTYSFF